MTTATLTAPAETAAAPPTAPAPKVPNLALHDLCKIIPPHTEEEFKELKEDIRKNKLQVPIKTFQGYVLDGRGRYNACVELDKEWVETGFKTDPFPGSLAEARAYVISTNVKRRHLNESQRAIIAAGLTTFTHGGDRSKASIDALTQKQAAELLNISEPSVERACKVLKTAVPAVIEAIKKGELRVSAVGKFVESKEQDKLMAAADSKVAKAVKDFIKAPADDDAPDENDDAPNDVEAVGGDREAEDIELGRGAGLNVEGIKARWADAREQVEALAIREAAEDGYFAAKAAELVKPKAKGEPLFISPEIQPKIEPKVAPAGRTLRRDGGYRPKEVPLREETPKPRVEPHPKSAKALITIMSDLQAKRSPLSLGPTRAESEGLDGEILAFQHSKSPSGIPPSFENAIVAVRVMKLDCRYDVFHDRISIKDADTEIGADSFENFENAVLLIREAAVKKFGFDPGSQFMYDALKLQCMQNSYDPVLDYLNSLEWDGVSRVDDWLVRYCGAQDTPFIRAVGRKVLIAAVRRVKEPGCKFDYILVMEGPQGVGKSTALKILAGGEENFSDAEILGVDKREQQEAVQGVWIYEVAELDGLSKSEVTRVKVFLSKAVDSARPAYGRARVDRKRRCIFVATTNEDTYLRDTTGNRRFWIVPVGKIDLVGLARDRDQLWAEAVALEAQSEPLVLHETLWAVAAAIAKQREEVDPWEDMLERKLASWQAKNFKSDGAFTLANNDLGEPEWRVSTACLLNFLEVGTDRQTNNHTKRLATVMRNLGWERPETPIRIGEKICRGFKKTSGGGPRLRASAV